MYHHPFPTPATPGHNDRPFHFPPPSALHHPPAHIAHPHPAHSATHPPHPTHAAPHHNGNLQRHPSLSQSTGSSRRNSHGHHHGYSESESEGEEDKAERDKLELRREKNRVKQRNLRLRRANHIADLERDVSNLKSEAAGLRETLHQYSNREAVLQHWVHDLESALFQKGGAGEVESLRRMWGDRDMGMRARGSIGAPGAAVGGVGGVGGLGPANVGPMPGVYPPQPAVHQMPPADPLSTLARAASSIPQTNSAAPAYPHAPPQHQLLPTPAPSTSVSASASAQSSAGGDPYAAGRPSLPRPPSFSSRPFDNPYPTPDLPWGSQLHDYMQHPVTGAPMPPHQQPQPHEIGGDLKRKRSNEWDYAGMAAAGFAASVAGANANGQGRPSSRGGVNGMGNMHTLPPLHTYGPGAGTDVHGRPLSAHGHAAQQTPQQQQQQPMSAVSVDGQGQGQVQGERKSSSPKLLRIADLMSPSQRLEHSQNAASTSPTAITKLPPIKYGNGVGETGLAGSGEEVSPRGRSPVSGLLPTPMSDLRA
ncbi:hypothetical protein IAT38_002206 [Cryptococcus sp. DSM 104549]